MKRARLHPFLRRSLGWLGALILCAVLYALSFGPATAWVVSAVSGRQPSALDPATYDGRLSAYKRFYSPLLSFRMWLLWCVSPWPEELFWRYDALFARPAKLADGRRVFTTVGAPLRPGESAADYVRRLLGSDEPVPRPGTEIYNLPRSHRVLIVLAPDEDILISIVLDAALEHSATFYADLKIP